MPLGYSGVILSKNCSIVTLETIVYNWFADLTKNFLLDIVEDDFVSADHFL